MIFGRVRYGRHGQVSRIVADAVERLCAEFGDLDPVYVRGWCWVACVIWIVRLRVRCLSLWSALAASGFSPVLGRGKWDVGHVCCWTCLVVWVGAARAVDRDQPDRRSRLAAEGRDPIRDVLPRGVGGQDVDLRALTQCGTGCDVDEVATPRPPRLQPG